MTTPDYYANEWRYVIRSDAERLAMPEIAFAGTWTSYELDVVQSPIEDMLKVGTQAMREAGYPNTRAYRVREIIEPLANDLP